MMDWTDRHCRFFHRLMTRRARLYTEMLTTGAIIHGDRARLLGFDASEHPVALQLGGSNPDDLATAARIGEDFGYDEINLNVGCPSDRVKDGRFGACLMAEPELVARGVAAMKHAVKIPVTVKCRIGIDDQDPEQAKQHLKHVDGVMLGRAAYQEPWRLLAADAELFGEAAPYATMKDVLTAMLPYMEDQLARGVRLHAMSLHFVGAFHGVPGARAFRRHLAENGVKPGAGVDVLRGAIDLVDDRAPASLAA